MTGLTSLTNAPVSREAVAEYLERHIVSGRYAPGERLPSERHLAEELRVSRPIVREALRVLVERNLVEVLPGRGAYVRDSRALDSASRFDSIYRLGNATPRDLVEARTMLECTAAALAAERATDLDLAALDTAVRGCEQSPTIMDKARFDLAFHLGVARAAKNPVIETMFRSISALTIELMFRSLSDSVVTNESLPLHTEIVNAIRARDPERARLAMAGHLAVASRHYGADFEDSVESVAKRQLARMFAPGVTLEELMKEVSL
jgi:GntR family transcriptional regulator, transcriptional repressor for pyruvate dehydrogenase complex